MLVHCVTIRVVTTDRAGQEWKVGGVHRRINVAIKLNVVLGADIIPD